jgi:Protein kinase domain/PASTA domain
VANFAERYELVRRIGSGGMGEVWLARDEQLAGRPVAIKIMHAHMLSNTGDVARFQREMRLAALMDHPNIVTVYTTGTLRGAPFMVMEYLRGQDLEKAPPGDDPARVASIGRDICGALAYAHDQGVIHRDIKPGNLFLCDTGQVKVTDFGIATAVGGTTLSTAGMLVGTFAYLPPERWRGEQPVFGNDIWAAGCVLYLLLSGRLPRVLPGAAEYAAAAVRGDPVPDLRDLTSAPAWLSAAVMAMLHPDPHSRPTAGDCVRLLSGLPARVPAGARTVPGPGLPALSRPPGGPERGMVTSLVTAPVPAPSRRPWRPGRFLVAAGGAVAVVMLLAVSLAAWQFYGSPQATGPAAGRTAASPPASHATRTVAVASVSAPGSVTASAAGSPSASPAGTPKASPAVSKTASTAPLVAIPDVKGMSFAKARVVLENDGFVVVGNHAHLGQTVTGVSPSGQAPAGSTVTVTYGTGP